MTPRVTPRIGRIGIVLAACAAVATPATAQWASDFPGVPRAAISIRGSKQTRTDWSFGVNQAPAGTTGDTIGGSMRFGFGRSYRIGDQFEVGFDYTFAEFVYQQPPAAAAGEPDAKGYMRALTGYGFRFGAKIRPYSSIDQDGNGYQVAFGLGFQPKLSPLFGIEKAGDSSRTGGQFSKAQEPRTSNSPFKANPFAALQTSTMLAAMGSYRSKRLLADGALMNESLESRTAPDDPSPVTGFGGFSLRIGGAYRVTRSIAIGAALWGNGAPPWRDDIRLGVPGKAKDTQYALLFQFGSAPEGGRDLMISSPTGNFAESVRIYLRTRATR